MTLSANESSHPNTAVDSRYPQSKGVPNSAFRWVRIGLLLFAIYVLSFAPACWIAYQNWDPYVERSKWVRILYSPILTSCKYGPEALGLHLTAYVNFPFTRRHIFVSESGLGFYIDAPIELWILK